MAGCRVMSVQNTIVEFVSLVKVMTYNISEESLVCSILIVREDNYVVGNWPESAAKSSTCCIEDGFCSLASHTAQLSGTTGTAQTGCQFVKSRMSARRTTTHHGSRSRVHDDAVRDRILGICICVIVHTRSTCGLPPENDS